MSCSDSLSRFYLSPVSLWPILITCLVVVTLCLRHYLSHCRPSIRKQSVWSSHSSCQWKHLHLHPQLPAICNTGMARCVSCSVVIHHLRLTLCYQWTSQRCGCMGVCLQRTISRCHQLALLLWSLAMLLLLVSMSVFLVGWSKLLWGWMWFKSSILKQ